MHHGGLFQLLARAAMVALALLSPTGAGEPDGAEWERPWEGLLPDPDQGFAMEDRAGNEWFAMRVVDAATLAPIAGARLTRTPEWVAPGRLRHDAVLSVGFTDADGIARVPSQPWLWSEDCHWIVSAPGYAPAYDYGTVPESGVLLARGVEFVARLLDSLGRPVAGGAVEILGGCSHGTALARAVAGPDGIVQFPCTRPLRGQLWIEGPGIASDLYAFSGRESLGTRPLDIVLPPALRYEGRVLDLLGQPVAGAVVRALNEQRGPAALTDARGRFVLDGVEHGRGLHFFPPADLKNDSWRHVDDACPAVPMTVILSPAGIVEPRATARVRVRARLPDGSPAEGLWFRLVRMDTGRGPEARTALPEDEDDLAPGDASVEAAPGRYRVLPTGPLGWFTFDPAEVTIVDGKINAIELRARSQPRLRIRGALPPGASLVLAVPGFVDEGSGAEWAPRLPSTGPAVLRVQVEGRAPFFFPVGPAKDGTREVKVALPPPRRVLPAHRLREGRLFDGPRPVLCFRDGKALATDAEGRVAMRWTDDDQRTFEVPVELPRSGGAEVQVDAGSAREGQRRVVVVAFGPDEEWERQERVAGERVVFARDGWQTLSAVVPADPRGGKLVLRWGNAALKLLLRQADGSAADAVVLVDGVLHLAPAGELHLRGLQPGPHRVLAALRDEVGGGKELRLVLEPGETRDRTVLLGSE